MSDSASPGWYHAEGDPPNTERYWDGFAWTEGPRPIAADGFSSPTGDDLGLSSSMPDGADSPGFDTPNIDMPPTDSSGPADSGPGSSMPLTGSSMPVTGSGGGLDDGFPSIDDSPSLGSYDAAPSSLPGDAPGGFPATTPPASSVPQGFPPAANMPGGSQMPATGAPGSGFGAPAHGGFVSHPEESQATTSLVLSIVGLFCCGLPAGIGAYMGYKEKEAIDAGQRDPSNRGMAIASLVIAVIALGIWAIVYLLFFIGAMLG